MSVGVLDRSGKPLMPCSEKRARLLLERGRARVHRGRVAVRASGSFNLQTGTEVVQGISHRHCQVLQRADGYGYSQQQSLTRKEAGEGRAERTTRSTSPA